MLHWDTKGEIKNVSYNESHDTYTFQYPCESHEICYPYVVTLSPGVYTFECYGGTGGPAKIAGGKAASTKGTIILYNEQTFYLFVGAKGLQYSKAQVFGGGGSGSMRYVDGSGGGSGGGASDIRIFEDDFNSRIMVAGGGAGSEYYFEDIKGGDAGTIKGEDGQCYNKLDEKVEVGGGGTQTGGGTGHKQNNMGQFGLGGNSDNEYGSGGGGGYFGGGGGSSLDSTVSSGGGGSSFIAGHKDCKINNAFSRFTFFHASMSSGYDQEPKIVITIHGNFRSCHPANMLLSTNVILNTILMNNIIIK